MIIEKNGKVYTVAESRSKWSVSTDVEQLTITYDVSKDICNSFDELQEYVLSNDIFN